MLTGILSLGMTWGRVSKGVCEHKWYIQVGDCVLGLSDMLWACYVILFRSEEHRVSARAKNTRRPSWAAWVPTSSWSVPVEPSASGPTKLPKICTTNSTSTRHLQKSTLPSTFDSRRLWAMQTRKLTGSSTGWRVSPHGRCSKRQQ